MPWMAIDPQRVLDLTDLEQASQFLDGRKQIERLRA